MNLKHLILLSTVLLQVVCVKSDCDDYLTCLSDFFSGFFVDDHNGTLVNNNNVTGFNSTDLIEDGERNASVKLFEIEDFGKSLEKVLLDVTSLVREEIEENLKIISESNVFRTVDDKTDIYVKAYDLDRKDIANVSEINSNPNFNITDKVNNDDGYKNVLNITPISLTAYSDINNSTKVPITSNGNDSATPTSATKTTDTDNNLNNINITNNEEIDRNIPTTSTTVSTATKTTDNVEIKTYFFIPEEVIEIKENIELTNALPVFNTDLTTVLPISTIASNDFTTKLPTSTQNTEITRKIVKEEYLENQDDKIDLTTIKPRESTDQNLHPKLLKAVIYNITKVQEFNDIINVKENEISNESFDLDYEIDDNATDYPIIDYIDLYKDTTNENVVYIPTEIPTISGVNNDLNNVIEYTDDSLMRNGGHNTDDISASNDNETAAMVPWIATIFIKNGSSNQFEYTCDGALLSERVVLTAAHCVAEASLDPENFIIILGKRSLIASTQYERVHKVKQLKLHGNFSSETGENDLAVLILEEATVYSDAIQPACLEIDGTDNSVGEAVTTGWAIDGNLTLIHFLKEKSETCVSKSVGNTFCATYGNEVATCPSYGGLYSNKRTGKTCLKGIRAGNPANRGFCIERNVYYTSLKNYVDWLNDILSINKN